MKKWKTIQRDLGISIGIIIALQMWTIFILLN